MSFNAGVVEKRVLYFQDEISRLIRGPRVLQRLHDFITPAESNDIKRRYNLSPEKATRQMIELLLKSDRPGKWRAFLEALDLTDYPYLVSLLKYDEHIEDDCCYQRNIIQLFAPYLESQINPRDIIDRLNQSGIINDTDTQEILARESSQGMIAATMVLLDRIQCRLAPKEWYHGFLRVLVENGHADLVKEIEPDFSLDSSDLKYPVPPQSTDTIDTTEIFNTEQEQLIELRISEFKQELIELVRLDELLVHIDPDLLPKDTIEHLLCMESSHNAMDQLLDTIRNLQTPNKWTRFVEWLRKSDYYYLADVLSCAEEKRRQREMYVIRVVSPCLENQIDPRELIPFLMAESVINERDKQSIMAKYEQSGCVAASIVLLDCIKCRLQPRQWYTAFLQVLLKSGRADLAKVIDPEYCMKRELDNDTETTSPPTHTTPDFARLNCMSEELDSSFTNIRQTEHSIHQEIMQRIRQRYDTLEKVLLDELREKIKTIENPLQKARQLVEDSKRRFSQMSDDDSEVLDIDKIDHEVKTAILHTVYHKLRLEPSDEFQKCNQLGKLCETRGTLVPDTRDIESTDGYMSESENRIPLQHIHYNKCVANRLLHKYDKCGTSVSDESLPSSGFVEVIGPNKPSLVRCDHILSRQLSQTSSMNVSWSEDCLVQYGKEDAAANNQINEVSVINVANGNFETQTHTVHLNRSTSRQESRSSLCMSFSGDCLDEGENAIFSHVLANTGTYRNDKKLKQTAFHSYKKPTSKRGSRSSSVSDTMPGDFSQFGNDKHNELFLKQGTRLKVLNSQDRRGHVNTQQCSFTDNIITITVIQLSVNFVFIFFYYIYNFSN